MSREDILALIDNETHPVNMGRATAVEFLEDLAGDIHQRIIKLLREGDGPVQNEIVIATGRVIGVNSIVYYATNKWSLAQFTSTLELDKELDGSNTYVVHEKAELGAEYEFVLRPKDNTPLPPPALQKVPRFFEEEDSLY